MSTKSSIDRVDIFNQLTGYSDQLFNDKIFHELICNHSNELHIFLNFLSFIKKKYLVKFKNNDILAPDICEDVIIFNINNPPPQIYLMIDKFTSRFKLRQYSVTSNINSNNILNFNIIKS